MRDWLGAWLLAALAAVSLVGCVDLSARTPAGPPVANARDVAPDTTVAEVTAECERTAAAGDWDGALQACERVAADAPDTPGLSDRLVTVYLAKGRAALSPGDVLGALRWFDRAHDLRPDLAEVAGEYTLALAYRAGEIALAAGRWDDAVGKFQAVHDADPLYLAWLPERAPLRRLAEAEAAWGQALLGDRDLDEAQNHCARASELAADLSEATACLGAIAAARAPTPTPTPTPAPTRAVPVVPRPAPPAAVPPRPAPPATASPRTARPPATAAPPPSAPAGPPPAPAAPPLPNVPRFGAPG
ncbi:MAG TPA: tetratricopeptide repeat protein [Chloroflexota bacterium]|nr:tetratricopeptide repeat protein [Chloroflexota bacterium]